MCLTPLNLKLLKMVKFTLCGFYHDFLKWGQKSKSRVIVPPLKETGSAQLQSLSPDCTGSDAILFILVLVSSEGSSWPPAIGPFSAGVMACTRLWDPQLTFEGWREGPQSGLVDTPPPHRVPAASPGLGGTGSFISVPRPPSTAQFGSCSILGKFPLR